MRIVKPKMVIFDWNGTLVYNDKNNTIRLLPNAFKVVKKLHELGIFVALISNTYKAFLDRTARRFQIAKYMLNIIGTRGEIEHRKPSKEVVDYALMGAGIDDVNIDTVWMVGNSMQDVETAYNAGIKPVIFGRELLDAIIYGEGFKKNQKSIYVENHLEFLKIIKEFESENA